MSLCAGLVYVPRAHSAHLLSVRRVDVAPSKWVQNGLWYLRCWHCSSLYPRLLPAVTRHRIAAVTF